MRLTFNLLLLTDPLFVVVFQIDLLSVLFYTTPFFHQVTWLTSQSYPIAQIDIRDPQRIRGQCWGQSGGCGGCVPSSALPGFHSDVAYAYMTEAASRVIDLAYNATLGNMFL